MLIISIEIIEEVMIMMMMIDDDESASSPKYVLHTESFFMDFPFILQLSSNDLDR